MDQTDQITDHLDALATLAAEEGLPRLEEALALCRKLYRLERASGPAAKEFRSARRAIDPSARRVTALNQLIEMQGDRSTGTW